MGGGDVHPMTTVVDAEYEVVDEDSKPEEN